MWSNASILVGNFAASNPPGVSEGGLLREQLRLRGRGCHEQQQRGAGDGLGSVWTNGLDLYIRLVQSGQSVSH